MPTGVAALPILLSIGLAPIVLLIRDVRARLLIVVFGAMIVFQSSSTVTTPKLAYLVALAVAVAIAVPTSESRIVSKSAVVGFILVLLSVGAIARGRQPVLVFRDASNYVLLLLAAPLAVHFGAKLPERTLARITLTAALAGTYSFTARWTSNRGLAHLPSIGVPSGMLLTLAVAFPASMAVLNDRSVRWWAVSAIVFAAGLVTGTRSLLVLIVAPVAIILVSRRAPTSEVRQRARKSARRAVAVLPVFGALTLLVAAASPIDVHGALNRIGSATQVATSFGNSGASASLTERQLQQSIAFTAFQESPIVGSGPGTLWTVARATSGGSTVGTSMDTSLVLLAKWGMIGAAALIWLIIAWWGVLRPTRDEPTVWGFTALGIVPVFIVQSLLAPVVEDRGLPLTLILLGAGTHAARRRALTDQIATRGAQVASKIV